MKETTAKKATVKQQPHIKFETLYSKHELLQYTHHS